MQLKKLRRGLSVLHSVRNNIEYFRDYLGFIEGEHTLHFRNGLSLIFRARTQDRTAINEVLIYNLYQKKGFAIHDTDIVVDIGAHIGTFTLLASKSARHGKVLAYEPEQSNFSLLQRNLLLNNCENTIPFLIGVAGTSGTKTLYIPEGNLTDAPSLYTMHHGMRKIEISTTSLKDILLANHLRRIDYLKMDCEGGEYEILYETSPKVLQKIKKIVLEYHNINEARKRKGLPEDAPSSYNNIALTYFLKKQGYEVIVNAIEPRRGLIYAYRK